MESANPKGSGGERRPPTESADRPSTGSADRPPTESADQPSTGSADRPPEACTYRPIGVARTPFAQTEGMPIQPPGARGVRGSIELRPELAEAVADLDGFSHIIVLYHFHRAGPSRLTVTPFLDNHPRGVFATRAPVRPNPIGLSVLRLLGVEGTVLHVADVDLLDGTPILDIKPYVPDFDHAPEARTGWLADTAASPQGMRADTRFGATGRTRPGDGHESS